MTDHATLSSLPVRTTRLQDLARRLLACFGWRVLFDGLPGPRGVVIVYPHTSNWDFIIGLLAKWTIGVRFRWLGKESLFRGASGALLGPFFRACGGEPVERGSSTGAIDRLARRIREADWYWLALSPEGTRKYVPGWRSGFYHIARTARIPVGLACIDYGRREVRLVDFAEMSGDEEADLARIREVFEQCTGYRPQCAAPIAFASRATAGSASD